VHFLTVCVKYLQKDNFTNPVTKLLTIIELGEKSTAEELYNKIKSKILTDELIQKNMMAIVTDQEPAMIGCDKGLTSRLQNDFKYVFAFNDLSHIYHLICKNAVQTYKQDIYRMVKYTSAHFTRSPLRVAILERIQKEKGRLSPLNVLPFKKNRWLSLTACLERVMKIWEDLKFYFTEVKDKEGLKYLMKLIAMHNACLFFSLNSLIITKSFKKTI